MKYLHLISGPRNISTALMYSFAQRPDTIVMDEPFYAVYLAKTGVNHPGKDNVLAAQSSDEKIVLDEIFQDHEKPVLFIKNMAHHIEVLEQKFLADVINIFLIRNPRNIISSYAEVIDKPVMRDIGIRFQYDLFSRLKNNGETPLVIDSGLLLENPASVLRQICDRTGIQYREEMLQWSAGPKSYDGVWAPYWYENVHRSTGFEKQSSSARELPQELISLHEEAAMYYKKLLPFSLKPE